MNKYLRQLFTAVVALFVILGLSSTIIMAVRANALNNDPRCFLAPESTLP